MPIQSLPGQPRPGALGRLTLVDLLPSGLPDYTSIHPLKYKKCEPKRSIRDSRTTCTGNNGQDTSIAIAETHEYTVEADYYAEVLFNSPGGLIAFDPPDLWNFTYFWVICALVGSISVGVEYAMIGTFQLSNLAPPVDMDNPIAFNFGMKSAVADVRKGPVAELSSLDFNALYAIG